ncbi:anthranilate synthase component II [Flavisolibacter tropicus]|uniref:Anthranilate synthase subunit II n=1 Tax=Flavisolibacter tropicus TaxID=1492898 RepID=A0A172TRY5_9BACT|nr:aminodeoxychorismate/anthranilate synthase component II [Flavisolibacter tropicus]ANE49831.1 anthranilate synthase subunit II [Flavisolibacter tropicus]
MKILVFDNYDSFTYNLVHLVKKIVTDQVDVYRNDEIPLEEVAAYDKIILSPGPGLPSEAGELLPLINAYASQKSILGVCLGHQAIGEAFGGKLINLKQVYHGVATPVVIGKRESATGNESQRFPIHDSRKGLFEGLGDQMDVGRYHSWVISEEGFPEELEVTARDENDYIMALQHKSFDVQGVQFHPESVLTPLGEQILRNWLKK